jgi:hypothetical protein
VILLEERARGESAGEGRTSVRNEIEDAWSALQRSLEIRSRELQEEVRTYPTPIARCDVQLTQIIEERDAAVERLKRAGDLEGVRATVPNDEWLARLRAFAAGLELEDGETAARARERLLAALGG